jgi:hypothetical protein
VSANMKLSEQRCLFSALLGQFITWITTHQGYTVAVDQVKRSQADADAHAQLGDGISNSLHLNGLAADLLLYLDGNYLPNTHDYALFGAYWKSLHPLNCWGGDFSKPDGNHFSSMRNGVR